MIANTITIARTVYAFVVIVLFGRHPTVDIALIFSIALIFGLDALDGYIARILNKTSETGALLDTLADRIVENTFWLYFTVEGVIPLWMPLAVMARGVLTDTLQKSFGYPQNGWTHALTRSRISRGLYGIVKMLTFVSLASLTLFENSFFRQGGFFLATITVCFCLLRGLPFFFFRKTSCPRIT